jgi:hypothetical protein
LCYYSSKQESKAETCLKVRSQSCHDVAWRAIKNKSSNSPIYDITRFCVNMCVTQKW